MGHMDDKRPTEASGPLMQVQPLWQHIGLFHGLDSAATEAISHHLHIRPFQAGDVLIQQDRWCGELFIMRSGVAQVSWTKSEPGEETPHETPKAVPRETTLRRLVSGDSFGEMSLITGAMPSATVRALTDGEVWVLGQDDFRTLVRDYPGLTQNINVILSERLFHTNRQQVQPASHQMILVVADAAPLWDDLARTLAVLTGQATLFVDFGPRTDGTAPVYRVEDLLSGRLDGALTPRDDRPERDAYDPIIVRGADITEPNAAGAVGDLVGALSRLEDRYHHVLIVVPPDSPQITASLLALATHLLVAGAADSATGLRSRLAALPTPDGLPAHPDVGVILTEARFATPPATGDLDRLSTQAGAPVWAVIPAADTNRATAIAALARRLTNQRIGVAFGGGGVKGWAHLGVVRVLRRLQVPLDCVTGTSIGAICAAMVARGGTLHEYENLLRIGATYAFHPKISRIELLSSRAVSRFLRREDVLGERLIEDLSIPFAAVAADLNAGSEIVLRRGLAWQAVLASAAIPGLFSPVQLGGHCLVDGAVIDPVPISTAQILGANKVIAIDISTALAPRQEISLEDHSTAKLPNMVGTMLRSFEIMSAQIRAHSIERPSVLIKPQMTSMSLRRFGDGGQFVEAGEAAAEAALPHLFREFPWLKRNVI